MPAAPLLLNKIDTSTTRTNPKFGQWAAEVQTKKRVVQTQKELPGQPALSWRRPDSPHSTALLSSPGTTGCCNSRLPRRQPHPFLSLGKRTAVEETIDGFTLRMQGHAVDIPPARTQPCKEGTTTKHCQQQRNKPRNMSYGVFTPLHSIQPLASNQKHYTHIRSVTAMGAQQSKSPGSVASAIEQTRVCPGLPGRSGMPGPAQAAGSPAPLISSASGCHPGYPEETHGPPCSRDSFRNRSSKPRARSPSGTTAGEAVLRNQEQVVIPEGVITSMMQDAHNYSNPRCQFCTRALRPESKLLDKPAG